MNIKSRLQYHEDGYFTWKKSPARNVKKGQRAGWVTKEGYEKIRWNGKQIQTHRLVWLYHFGYLPKQIDHIDGDGLNNRISNLREATSSQNSKNRGLRSDNESGYKGVTRYPSGKYGAFVNKKYYGSYATAEEANEVAIKVREELHGEFCRHT